MSKKSKERQERIMDANLYCRHPLRGHMGDLSNLAFGGRGRWKKIATQYGLTIEEIKEQMEKIIYNNAMKRRALEDASKKVRSGETESESSTNDSPIGSSQGDELWSDQIRREQLEEGDGLQQAPERSNEASDSVE